MWHSLRSISQRQPFVSPTYQKMEFSHEKQQDSLEKNLIGSQLRDVYHMKRNNILSIKKNQLPRIPTNFGAFHYKPINNATFDLQMSTYKRMFLERKHQLLGSLPTYIYTGNPAYLYNVSDKHKVLKGLGILGNVASALKKMEFYSQKKQTKLKPNLLASQSQESNFHNQHQAKVLHVDRNFNLKIENNQVYGIPTDYGIINYKFINDGSSRYVQQLYYDNQMSDYKRVHLERKRQLLQDIQTFIHTGNPAWLHTARDNSEILKGFESFGITTEEPFTINGSKRYRISPSGILHNVDLESKGMREQDWRKYGHDENTVFLIQGKEYKMDENGRLPLPEDYVHKYEQVKIFKRN